ncbi:hypothetical protein [Phenylobacterium sp.]|uniref:hypothetical protein n=1 Tax=Phenylobacterium sp. TaxID=1871053 RepID=UPI002F3F3ECC
MRNAILAGLTASLLSAGAAWASAPAQSPTPSANAPPTAEAGTTVEGLTVIAPKAEQEKLPTLVEHFVQAHSAESRIGQLSRWGGPVCPQTSGLPPAFDAYVSARVKLVAAGVGAPVDKHPNRNFPCKANLLIVFTTEPQKLMDDVRRHHPKMLGFHYAAQAERLARMEHPFQAWYMTGTKTEGGLPEPDDEFRPTPGGTAGSRLSVRLESQIMAVLVVVDASKIVGHQIGAISDDVAMLALAHGTAPKGCSELPTIVDFLNPDCPAGPDPAGLSTYDVAYLKGLYSTNPELFAHAQQSEIGSHILHEVKATAP